MLGRWRRVCSGELRTTLRWAACAQVKSSLISPPRPDACAPTPTQTQAIARALQLQRMAQLRLRALSQERPKLVLSLVMHAPKIAVPDGKVRGAFRAGACPSDGAARQ